MELQFIIDRLEAIDEKFDKKLDAILIQTTKTNGRVSGLERWRKAVEKLLWWVLGIAAAIAVMLLEKFIN